MSKKNQKSPSLKSIAEFREILDEHEERERQHKQASEHAKIDEAMIERQRMNWRSLWKQLNKSIISYQNGDSSRALVDNLCSLNAVVDEVGFAEQINSLRDIDAWPTFQETRDKIHVAICKIVVEVWSAIRFGDADSDDLVAALDANKTRQPIDEVGFVRHVVEAGGFPLCQQCKNAQPPWEVLRSRCDACRESDKTSLMALHTTIEGEHRHGAGAVYTGGVIARIPQCNLWRKRLLDYVGKVDETDHELLKAWTTYARREHGLDGGRFWSVQFDDADSVLPPDKVICFAHDQSNAKIAASQALEELATGTNFHPEACDDDLWFQLDVCIRAMETVEGGACGLIYRWRIGEESGAKYLQNISQLAEQAGWTPFVFPVEEGLEVERVGGGRALCRHHRSSNSNDEVGGEAVLSALRAWREKRAGELRSK